ncbi:Prephenate dehydrogenase OS=Streptomyces lavendulae subsp. lavendulae OX=58340 GN=SLAV_01895 PE=4 SV=1 [Streptomyces lavendulae subsp. lavendulae]
MATAERLDRTARVRPLKAGGLADAGRIESPGGDLHQFGPDSELVDLAQAAAALSEVGR